jgi:hypothetical protein
MVTLPSCQINLARSRKGDQQQQQQQAQPEAAVAFTNLFRSVAAVDLPAL